MQKYGWVGFSLCLLMGGGQRNAVHLESTTWSLSKAGVITNAIFQVHFASQQSATLAKEKQS